jgi:peptidoglycan/LPS O-acetylase OafA/YrhL
MNKKPTLHITRKTLMQQFSQYTHGVHHLADNYRNDIQGLRAIAVILVFCSHADLAQFGGGFIGVDIFFVISGYVITMMLLRSENLSRPQNLYKFYISRLRRLLPALLFMLIMCSIAAYWIMPSLERGAQYSAAMSAAIWLSNFFFSMSDIGYFNYGAEDNLFLHTWSLGVETQIYLVWPFLLAFGIGEFSKAKVASQKRLLLVLVGVIFISFLACVAWSDSSAKYAFYMMPTRAWQFGVGALVAFYHTGKHVENNLPKIALNFLGIAGLVIIFTCALLYNKAMLYPGWLALFPTVGSALLLIAGFKNRSCWATQLISTKPMRWLGDLSYSIYLWHWPILFFYFYVGQFVSGINIFHVLLVTLVLAMISYYLIEKPLRHSSRLIQKPSEVLGLSFILFFGCILTIQYIKTVSASQLEATSEQAVQIRQMPEIYNKGCDDWYSSSILKPCEFGNPNAPHTAVLVGDSIAAQWFPALARYYEQRGWRLVVMTKSACPMVNQPFFYEPVNSIFHVCDTWRNSALEAIAKINPDTVIFGSSARYPFTQQEWWMGTKDVLHRLAPHAQNVRLFLGTPSLPFDGPSCLARKDWLQQYVFREDQACKVEMLHIDSWVWLQGVADDLPNVKIIDLNMLVCPNDICAAEINGVPVFRDSTHLNVDFVLSLTEKIAAVL